MTKFSRTEEFKMTNNALANVITFDDMLRIADDLGTQAGNGVDTQIKFMLKMVEGGYHGALTMDPNKHGPSVDDATKLAETYVKARNIAVVFDAKAPNQRKFISTLRTGIKLGAWPKGGNGEPLATVNELMTIRQNLKKVPAEAKRLDDATNTLLNYARAQMKRDQLIEPSELRGFCYRKVNELPTAEDIIESCAKQLDKLYNGHAAQNTAQCRTANINSARQALRQELVSIATKRGASKTP
jgi:hypothetical protein